MSLALRALLLIGLAAAGFAAGWQVRDWKAGAAETKTVIQVVKQVEKQGEVTAKVAVKAEAAQARIRTVFETIHDQAPIYVTPEADRDCSVPLGFVRLHDAAAAAEPVSGPPAESDDAPSGVAISSVADTVADNYGTCHAEIQRLTDLQDWIRQQQALAAKR